MKGAKSLPNLDVSSTIDPRPDTQNVLATPYTEHSATDLLTCLCKLISHDSEQHVFPISIGDTFF